MNQQLLLDNLTNPALLFFALGILAVKLKSDLEIPSTTSKFISLYLLFSIGFKGGQELSHSEFSTEILLTILFAILAAILIPVYVFLISKRKLGVENAGAIAASYGSVSAVTFVTALNFLETLSIHSDGHMVAVMALMEAPAIIVGVLLIRSSSQKVAHNQSLKSLFVHSLTNSSVLLILGSLIIGYLANEKAAEGIKPFTNDLFKGFLVVFLLDMGINSARKLEDFFKHGWFVTLLAVIVPLINGCVAAYLSQFVTSSEGNRFILAILAASASYIAVPAAMKISVPNANPSIYVPMTLAITFPLNITLGMPIYLAIIEL
ncbi:MAG: sodium-dependent bicarbonate transport family permease [Crocinitomicaceae bacterium]|jgi:hypothetical protein